ncbi:MAG: DUF362 domain-containing protein, partial [Promethearchaeota archaeon]
MNETEIPSSRVAVIKSENPSKCFTEGLNQLGGIYKFIDEGDIVFLKISLRLPYGYPTNSNFDLIERVILTCKHAGAKKIYIGSFPHQGVALKLFDTIMGIEEYFKGLGAEFVYLDNSNLFLEKSIDKTELKEMKSRSFENVKVGENNIKIPKKILNADKVIVINQVNVAPLFNCELTLTNYHYILSEKARKLQYSGESRKELVKHDLFRQDYINNILNTYLVKKPVLAVNDLFYVLEGAGPLIYRDSNLKKTGFLIIGTDLISVDIITLRVLGFDALSNDLISAAKERSLGPEEISKIDILGEDLGMISLNIKECGSKLEDINIQSLYVNSGKMCSGCFLMAYHLLNFMNSQMIKDLKYIPEHSFLVGLDPDEPFINDKVILLGDCAIKSTENYQFRTKTTKTLIKKEEKEKKNKDILELPGCPPDFLTCLKAISKYFKKR